MAQLNIVSKIIEADKNGWSDLVNQIDEITQTLKYNFVVFQSLGNLIYLR